MDHRVVPQMVQEAQEEEPVDLVTVPADLEEPLAVALGHRMAALDLQEEQGHLRVAPLSKGLMVSQSILTFPRRTPGQLISILHRGTQATGLSR